MPIDKAALKELNVDAVLCISLADRGDRRQLLLGEFRDTELNIKFYLATRDPNPERGCFESHQACAQIALARGYERVLVLEDDATLERVSRSQVARINRFLRLRNPELFYLGTTLGTLWLTWRWGIARCRVRGTHAYMLNKAGCQRLAGLKYEGVAIDRVLSKCFKAYCSFPMLCQQQPDEIARSDIAKTLNATGMSAADWRSNWRQQYKCAWYNLGKTVIRKDL